MTIPITPHKKLTLKQVEFRNKILKIKPKHKKEKPLPLPPEVTTINQYMNNCMFWINKFEKGETSKESFLKAVTYLRIYCNQIIEENK